MTVSALKNVIVVGGSYVGLSAAQQIASILPATHRVLLVEPHSHFHHLFAFPRFAIVPDHEHKAFVPYTGTWKAEGITAPEQHAVVQAKVLQVQRDHIVLDRQWQGSTDLPFEFITIATGTRLTPPGNVPNAGEASKPEGIAYFQQLQGKVAAANSIVIIGGGAVGVQMATDIKELFPTKKVTVVQSRDQLMPRFDRRFHDILLSRFEELGIDLVANNRVVIPPQGFPETGEIFSVDLNDGRKLETQLVIQATGQKPNNELVGDLPGSSPDSIINPANGYIRVKPTMQFSDPLYPNFFAVGDIADTGAHKAARPGVAQAAAIAANIASMLAGKAPNSAIEISPAGIHMTLGMTKNIVFRNPNPGPGEEPWIKWRNDGATNMNVDNIWARRGVQVNSADDYYL